MQNIKAEVVDGKLILTIDLNVTEGTVTKGGNLMIATSGNWQYVDGRPDLSLNCVLVKSNKRR